MINCDKNIIKFLKENKKNGKPFHFLPYGIRQWIYENIKNPLLMFFDFSIDTLKFKYIDPQFFEPLSMSDIGRECIFALPDDYEKQIAKLQQQQEEKQESKTELVEGWNEFTIDEYGCFTIYDRLFHWSEWSRALWEKFGQGNLKPTAFGGWYYKGKGWYMLPIVAIDVLKPEKLCATAYASGERVESVIPQKVKFWFKNIWRKNNV